MLVVRIGTGQQVPVLSEDNNDQDEENVISGLILIDEECLGVVIECPFHAVSEGLVVRMMMVMEEENEHLTV